MADPTATLIASLYAAGDGTSSDAAKLIEWFLDERATLVEALDQERQHARRTGDQLDEAVGRLNRLGDHLRALTVYAEGDDDHGPPADPFPTAEAGRDG